MTTVVSFKNKMCISSLLPELKFTSMNITQCARMRALLVVVLLVCLSIRCVCLSVADLKDCCPLVLQRVINLNRMVI